MTDILYKWRYFDKIKLSKYKTKYNYFKSKKRYKKSVVELKDVETNLFAWGKLPKGFVYDVNRIFFEIELGKEYDEKLLNGVNDLESTFYVNEKPRIISHLFLLPFIKQYSIHPSATIKNVEEPIPKSLCERIGEIYNFSFPFRITDNDNFLIVIEKVKCNSEMFPLIIDKFLQVTLEGTLRRG